MIIAVTGGIGSGKSLVTKILREAGKNVIEADKINSQLLREPFYIEKISQLFPTAVKDNVIDKSALRQIIFNDDGQRALLNDLAHPIIMQRIKDIVGQDTDDYFVEIPLFLENKDAIMFDRIWYISTPVDSRVERLVKRDNISYELADKMLLSQKNQEKIADFADVIIQNDTTETDLKVKVYEALGRYFIK